MQTDSKTHDTPTDANNVLAEGLSLEEAKKLAIVDGKKIRHRFYMEHEYIYFKRGWKTEEGYDLPFAYFLHFNGRPEWQSGWSEVS
jgi:hypothetical protein